MDVAQYLLEADPVFAWKTNNCGHFAFRWARLATGRENDIYSLVFSGKGAAQAKLFSLGSVEASVTHHLGVEPCAPTLARPGDIVYLRLPNDGHALGICAGRMAAFLAREGGIGMVPVERATCAWRIV